MITLKTRHGASPALARIGLLAVMAILGGPVVASPPGPQEGIATMSFSRALEACRFAKGGRPDQRNAAATNPYIVACLKRRGWSPDGLPHSLLNGSVAPTDAGLTHDRR